MSKQIGNLLIALLLQPGVNRNEGNFMVRGKQPKINYPALTLRIPSPPSPQESHNENELSKHVAIISRLSEAKDRISKVCALWVILWISKSVCLIQM